MNWEPEPLPPAGDDNTQAGPDDWHQIRPGRGASWTDVYRVPDEGRRAAAHRRLMELLASAPRVHSMDGKGPGAVTWR